MKMNVLNLINELPKLLRKPSPDQNYTDIFHEFEKDRSKCYSYAARAISIVCQDIEKNPNFDKISLQNYTDFMTEITKYIGNKKYEKFMLQNIKYFVYFLLNIGAEKQLKSFFKSFVIDEIYCEDSYKFYFEVVKNGQFYLLQKDIKLQVKFDHNVEICLQNLRRCMDVSDENQFLSFLTELFDHECSFNTLFKCQNHADGLIFFCISKLKNFSNCSNNLEVFFILITKIFLNLNKYEILAESKVFWSGDLLKSIVQNQIIKKNNYHHYALTLLLYIASLRVKEFSQSNLKEILRKQLKLFESTQNSAWYYDIQWTFIELFARNYKYILKNIEEENLQIIIEILYRIIKPISNITTYSKQNCYVCKNYQSHEVLNAFHLMVEIYDYLVQFDCDSNNAIFLVQYILSWIKKNYTNITQCKNMNAIFKKALSSFKKIISKVQTTRMAKISINFLNAINSDCFIQNVQDKIINARLYLHLYTILSEKLLMLELYAVILNLSSKNSESVNSYMVSFVKLSIELNMTTVTIKEVLQNCGKNFLNNEDIDESSFNFLIRKQLEIITMFKLLTNDEVEHLLEKIIDENILTQLEFVMIVRNLEQLIRSKKIQNKLEYIRVTEEKRPDDLPKYSILGHLYKYDSLRKFEECKNSFSFKITTEEDLTKINITDFNKINLNKECDNIEPAILSLHYFKNVFNIFDEKCCKIIDINAILDDLSYLARHFQLRGYLELAADAWFLVHSFTKHYEEYELYKMRAITFFCKYIRYNILEKYDLCLENELHSLSEKVLECYKNLENLSPRKQNYVLLYLLNVAFYYGCQHDIKSLKVLVKMVQVKINEIKERKFKFELVRAHLISLELYFRINTLEKLVVSPYIFVSHILRELKEVVYITSEDSLNMSCFLIELLQNLASFLLIILDTKMIMSYLMYVLSFSLQYGITLRITELLLIWTKISLQNGDINNSLLKLLLLEKLIIETETGNVSIDKHFNEAIGSTRNMDGLISCEKFVGEQSIEETRKAVQKISLSEKSLVFSQELQRKDFLKYLVKHNELCKCNICKFPVYKFCIFEIGSSYMKLNILTNKDKLMINLFLEESLKWWSKIDDIYFKMFGETVFHLYLDNIMWSRSNEKYSEAIDFCDIACKLLESIKNYPNNIWKVVEHYCALQSNLLVGETNVLKSPTDRKVTRKITGKLKA